MVNVCYYGSFSIVQFLTVLYIISFRTEYIRTESKLYRTYDLLSKWLLKHEDNTQKGGVCGIKRTRIPLLYGILSVLSVTAILPSSAPHFHSNPSDRKIVPPISPTPINPPASYVCGIMLMLQSLLCLWFLQVLIFLTKGR